MEQFNGTSWSVGTSPVPAGATSAALNGVTCASTTSCFAVGNYRVNANQYTLVDRYA
jgi:hypothetical protein